MNDTLPDADTLRGCLASLSEAPLLELHPLGQREQRDRYLDTPDDRLRQAGVALRIRELPGGSLITLKTVGEQVGSMHHREEIELPLSDPSPEHWPAAVCDRLQGVPLAALRPTLVLRTLRDRYLLRRGAYTLAELACDEVEAQHPDAARRVRFLELELEARDATDTELDAVAEALRDGLALTANHTTKLERALALLARHRPEGESD